jgi:hypothetical protein
VRAGGERGALRFEALDAPSQADVLDVALAD